MFNVWLNDGSSEMPDDDILYIICKDKILLKKKVGLMESIVPVEKISFLSDSIEEHAQMHINKIPAKTFSEVVAFFREVYDNYNRNEANTVIHYSKKGKYKIQVPLQKTAGASVSYLNEQVKGYQRIGTIHSHAGMSAFHSATDDSDEVDFDGLHITVGDVDQEHFSISCSIVSNGTRFVCEPLDYIEGIELVEFNKPGITTKQWKLVKGTYKLVENETSFTKTIGYKIKEVIGRIRFPKKWLEMVDKIKYEALAKEVLPEVPPLVNRYANRWGLSIDSGPSHIKRSPVESFNPCEQCPYKEHKSEMMMQEILNGLDDDSLDQLGFEEEEDKEEPWPYDGWFDADDFNRKDKK